MAITKYRSQLHACDAITDGTGWVLSSGSGGSITTDPDEHIEGTGGYGFDLDIETHFVRFTIGGGSINLTVATMFLWFRSLTPLYLDTWSAGAVKCRISDGTNYSEWYLGGSDRFTSSWTPIIFSTSSTPDAISGTLSLTAVTYVEYWFTGVTKNKLPANTFIDDFGYYGTVGGLGVDGGSSGSPIGFAELYTWDLANAGGIIQYVDGVYFLNGSLLFKNDADCYFKDTNQLIVAKSQFRNFTTSNRSTVESLVSSGFYTIGSGFYGSGAVNVQLGELSGGRGVSGCIFKTGGASPLGFDFEYWSTSKTLKFYGCKFIECGITYASGDWGDASTYYDSVWDGCGEVITSKSTFRYCQFINATSNAIQVDSASNFDVESCTFINPITAAVELTAAGPYDFTDLIFTGTSGSGPYDINNTYGSSITVNNLGTSNAAFYTGSTVNIVSGQKTFKFTLNPSIPGYEWRIYSVTALGSLAGANELDGEENAIADNQTYSYTYAGTVYIAVQIISQPDEDYEESITYYTLVDSNQDITINLEADINN